MKRLFSVLILLSSLACAGEVRVLLVADQPDGLVNFQTSSGTNWNLSYSSNSALAEWGFVTVSNVPVSALVTSANGLSFVSDIEGASTSSDLTVCLSCAPYASLSSVFSAVLASLTNAVFWVSVGLSLLVGVLLFRFVSLRSPL